MESPVESRYPLKNGGEAVVRDYGEYIVIDVIWFDGGEGICIAQAQLTGRDFQIRLETRY